MDHFLQYKSMAEKFSQSNWEKMDHFLQYKSIGVKSHRSRVNNFRAGPNSNSFLVFMPVLITCKFDKYLIKGICL